MYKLILRNNQLFAVCRIGACQQFEGKVINTISGECVDNPEKTDPGIFSSVYGGHGKMFHLSDNTVNPFYVKARAIFSNPEMLPDNSEHIFLDMSKSAFNEFEAKLITA